jgi:hypothetical protein
MKNIISIPILVILFSIFLFSCGKKEVKPREPSVGFTAIVRGQIVYLSATANDDKALTEDNVAFYFGEDNKLNLAITKDGDKFTAIWEPAAGIYKVYVKVTDSDGWVTNPGAIQVVIPQ